MQSESSSRSRSKRTSQSSVSQPTSNFIDQHLDMFNRKYIKYLGTLDYQITKNFKDANIQTRPVNSNGLWCCALIPMILFGYTLQYEVTPAYKLIAYLSLGLFSYSWLLIVFLSISCLVIKKTIFGGCMASSMISMLFIYLFLGESLLNALLFSTACVFSYSFLVTKTITAVPYTFTLGEAMIFQQGVVLFGAYFLTKFTRYNDDDEETTIINVFVFTALSTVGLLVAALRMLRHRGLSVKELVAILVSAVVYALAVLHLFLGWDAGVRVLEYTFRDQKRWEMFALWLFLVLVAIGALVFRTRLAIKATTVSRKIFHVLASLVFMTGIIYDIAFMKMAAGFGLGFIILVEGLRKCNIMTISPALDQAFHVYSDEKDCGAFAVTPIYLFAGLAAPLALCPAKVAPLELLAGVLAAGVGDSAASWAGRRYGSVKWPHGNKTKEGTAFNIASQVATVYALNLFEMLDSNNAVLRTCVAATVSGLVEAMTEQVDNLILPLVMLLGFQLTHLIA